MRVGPRSAAPARPGAAEPRAGRAGRVRESVRGEGAVIGQVGNVCT